MRPEVAFIEKQIKKMEDTAQELTPKGYQKKPGRNVGVDNVRLKKLYFKVNNLELLEITKRFESSEMNTLSQFLRQSALKSQLIIQQNKAINLETKNELRRVGVNLNQSVKALNQNKEQTITTSLVSQIQELTKLCYCIMDELK